ncbi:MAG: DEAD/DEAH box helicase, partial [bacterium]
DESDETGVSLLAYVDSDDVAVLDEPELIKKSLASDSFGRSEEPLADSDAVEVRWNEIRSSLEKFSQLRFVSVGDNHKNLVNLQGKGQESLKGNLKLFKQSLTRLNQRSLPGQQDSPTVFFLCDNETHAERMRDIFTDEEIDFSNLAVQPFGLHKGFVFPAANLVVYSEDEFYGRTRRLRLPKKSFQGLTPRKLKRLNLGDYVVHVDYGIGVFRGLKKIKVQGHERECLQLEYKDKDMVYVRVERMDRVNKYAPKEGATPTLSKLGSPEWNRLKARTKKKIKDMAKELIEIYAKRKAQSGIAFLEDKLWQRELEASFPYEDTPDQIKATLAVKKDMESPKPMDRLVCGDVGYGKTEIAVRAAFKSVMSDKQVAMLVPTTILAHQHYNTFRERLKAFPVNVEMLSRFRTAAEQKRLVDKLKTGEIDIIIGTHRLLSKDVKFKDLGLLIIDEDQRFVVRHKERLKRFRTTVDVLTLTATPIPRTLQFALMGARDMTNINTPPRNRLPIRTEILSFNKQYIREAILRELDRGGQVFFVHNRVRTIDRVAKMLSEMVPEADIAVAHGQMNEGELEKIMIDFMANKHDILVATMIIESGLDMPNVNTIIVNRADKLGLAQLYQLRGRVGRSHLRAYAYLLIPSL